MSARRTLAILLDVDGTLLDTVPFILDSVRAAFEGRARRPSDAEWIATIGTPLREQLEPYADGPEDLQALLDRYRGYQRERIADRTHPFPGALEVVRALHARGHPIGVVTGKLYDSAVRSLEVTGFAPFLGAVVAGDSCPEHKPHPGPVLRALELVGRAPGEALFVGDSTLDVVAGNAAGVVSVGALWGAATREALRDAGAAHLLGDVRELPGLVERLMAVTG